MTGKKLNYVLQTLIVFFMKLKLMTFMKIYFKIQNYLIIVIVQKIVRSFFDENKKVIGKIKDEAAGMPIKEFIGLRSKMYSYGTDPKFFSKIKELPEDTIEEIKKC